MRGARVVAGCVFTLSAQDCVLQVGEHTVPTDIQVHPLSKHSSDSALWERAGFL